jgi:hypothetical protein
VLLGEVGAGSAFALMSKRWGPPRSETERAAQGTRLTEATMDAAQAGAW